MKIVSDSTFNFVLTSAAGDTVVAYKGTDVHFELDVNALMQLVPALAETLVEVMGKLDELKTAKSAKGTAETAAEFLSDISAR